MKNHNDIDIEKLDQACDRALKHIEELAKLADNGSIKTVEIERLVTKIITAITDWNVLTGKCARKYKNIPTLKECKDIYYKSIKRTRQKNWEQANMESDIPEIICGIAQCLDDEAGIKAIRKLFIKRIE